ncbi:MAG: hypothetical protein ACM3PW_14475 [Chlamydiota bacterium]
MKSKSLGWLGCIAVLVLGSSVMALAQAPLRFSGLIGDYTPQTSTDGPWVVRGEWSLQITNWGKANFSAVLTMVRSDEGALTHGGLDATSARKAHTHHIWLRNADISSTNNGFKVTGPATITANGSPAFSPSQLEVDITGGTLVKFSNIKLIFQDPAAGHFGSQALNGVVRHVESAGD